MLSLQVRVSILHQKNKILPQRKTKDFTKKHKGLLLMARALFYEIFIVEKIYN